MIQYRLLLSIVCRVHQQRCLRSTSAPQAAQSHQLQHKDSRVNDHLSESSCRCNAASNKLMDNRNPCLLIQSAAPESESSPAVVPVSDALAVYSPSSLRDMLTCTTVDTHSDSQTSWRNVAEHKAGYGHKSAAHPTCRFHLR